MSGRSSATGRPRPPFASASPSVRLVLVAFDALVWPLALIVATWFRYEFGFTTNSVPRLVLLLVAASLGQVVVGAAFGLYTGWWRPGSFEETYAVTLTVGAVGIFITVLDLALGHPVPVAAAIVASAFALLGSCGLRWTRRLRIERVRARLATAGSTRVVIFGAGEGGSSVITAMRRDPAHKYRPVALLDDDPDKARLRLGAVQVCGGRDALETVARTYAPDMLVIAIPSADADLIRELSDRSAALGLEVRVLPTVTELIDRPVNVSDIRPVSYVDLLGRREVEIDLDSIASYLTGRRLLVTGAGGSIGSELCRQLKRYAPETLVMLDRDESALHAVQLSLDGRALLDDRSIVVADIRDRERLDAVFAEHEPDVVFHAAALKHLPLLEMYPQEAVKTNVWGTLNMLEASAAAGVERFVNISTDKAADAISVLGYSKRIAERLTSWFDATSPTSFMSVRFGNVLGSRGSVLTTFQRQIADGEPVTVTDPDVTRYFMTVEEAVRLVIQAGAFGGTGDALVLDMGEPVRIADVARRLIDESGSSCGIEFTGLRPGEKTHEVLLAQDEVDVRPTHPFISHVTVPATYPGDVRRITVVPDVDEVTRALHDVAYGPVSLPDDLELPAAANDGGLHLVVDMTAPLQSVDDAVLARDRR